MPKRTWTKVLEIGMDLLKQHELVEKGWKLKPDRMRRFTDKPLAVTVYSKKKILIHPYFAKHAPMEEVMDIMLHEIAHALVGFQAGHSRVWYRCARKIGCSGYTHAPLQSYLPVAKKTLIRKRPQIYKRGGFLTEAQYRKDGKSRTLDHIYPSVPSNAPKIICWYEGEAPSIAEMKEALKKRGVKSEFSHCPSPDTDPEAAQKFYIFKCYCAKIPIKRRSDGRRLRMGRKLQRMEFIQELRHLESLYPSHV